MKILSNAEMGEADCRTMDAGIPSAVLMENAGHRVVEFLEKRFAPLAEQRIVILAGKGNNGGDGLVIARQLFTRFRPRSLDVVLADEAPANLAMLEACGCPVSRALEPRMQAATLVIDALLGTGLGGPPRDPYASMIRELNEGFPGAKVVAVDIPSGLAGDAASTQWEHVRADHTITFTAPQPAHVLEPNASACGELAIAPIGTRAEFCQSKLNLAMPTDFAHLLAPRAATAHKGNFGHVLIVGGAPGKTGAANMSGLAALRAGAGLVTVCSSAQPPFPELMWQPLEEFDPGGKTVLAVGPGLGISPLVKRILVQMKQPVVLDADGLNSLAGRPLPNGEMLIMTPHPGEMSRLTGIPTADIQKDRINVARTFATTHRVTLVLKGRNTLTAFADGEVYVNTTGGPAFATGGSGDILTGLIAGMVAQFPHELRTAVVAAVWLHGRAADFAAAAMGEKCMIATDLLPYLPKAMEAAVAEDRAHFETASEEETIALGVELARTELPARGVVLLIGNLGAGKTTLTKGIAQGRGAATPDEVSSPTFTLIHEYGDPARVYHIDLYRLETEREVAALGLEELFEKDALVLIEWGERFPELWPPDTLELRIERTGENQRRLILPAKAS